LALNSKVNTFNYYKTAHAAQPLLV